MAGSSNYSQLVAKAEKAVEAVKNPALKRLAFEKVLDDMLGSSSEDGKRKTGISPTKPVARKKAAEKKAKKGGPQFYVEELEGEGFFKKPKTIAQVRTALGDRGHFLPVTSLSGPLQKLCKRKVLRRQKTTEKTTDKEKKRGYAYSQW